MNRLTLTHFLRSLLSCKSKSIGGINNFLARRILESKSLAATSILLSLHVLKKESCFLFTYSFPHTNWQGVHVLFMTFVILCIHVYHAASVRLWVYVTLNKACARKLLDTVQVDVLDNNCGGLANKARDHRINHNYIHNTWTMVFVI